MARKTPRSEPFSCETLEARRVFSAGGFDAPAAAFNANDLLVAVTVDEQAGPIAQWETSSGWIPERMEPEGTPGQAVGDPVAWQDPSDELVYAALPKSNGLHIYRELDPGAPGWIAWNVGADLPGSTVPQGEIVSLVTDSLVHVAGFDSGGDLVAYMQTGGVAANQEWEWTYVNLTDQLEARGVTMPDFNESTLISYVPSWNALHLAALDDAGQMWSVWTAPGMDQWELTNLSELTGASAMVGGLSSYLTSWDGINLTGVDANGELHAVWWVPEFRGSWRQDSLTEQLGAGRVDPDSVTAYSTDWDGLNIATRDESGSLLQYWWAQETNRWQIADLSGMLGNAPGASFNVATSPSRIALLGGDGFGNSTAYAWSNDTSWYRSSVQWTQQPNNPVFAHDPVNEMQSLVLVDPYTGERYDILQDVRLPPEPGYQTLPSTWSSGQPALIPLDEWGSPDWSQFEPTNWTQQTWNDFFQSEYFQSYTEYEYGFSAYELGSYGFDFDAFNELFNQLLEQLNGNSGTGQITGGASSFADANDIFEQAFQANWGNGVGVNYVNDYTSPPSGHGYSSGSNGIANGNGLLNICGEYGIRGCSSAI